MTALSPLSSLTPLPAHSSMDPAPSEHGVAPIFTTMPSLSNAVPLPAQANDIVPSVDVVTTRTLVLGNKTQITFTAADVKAPPIISFAHDIAGLNCMWDDTSSNWDNKSPLVICGRPIALVYWRDVYKSSRGKNEHWKPGQWRGTKDKWFKWRVGNKTLLLQPRLIYFSDHGAPLSSGHPRELLGGVYEGWGENELHKDRCRVGSSTGCSR